jgi:quercetin dioxygenase-like cupin family protein
MYEFRRIRRTIVNAAILASIAGLGIGLAMLQNKANAQRGAQGYMLAATEGEHLVRNGGSIFIKVAPSQGSDNLALGTQQVPARAGIPVHQHSEMDEVFYVLEGSGTFILNDSRQSVEKGGTIFIPKGSWHGFENPNNEMLLLWAVTPAGLEGFFREIASPPGAAPKSLTREQRDEIAHRYGTQFR